MDDVGLREGAASVPDPPLTTLEAGLLAVRSDEIGDPARYQ